MKMVSLFLLLFSSLFATVFDFKETRYYSALDFQRVSHGTIEIKKEETLIEYTNPVVQSIVLKKDGAYVLKDGDQNQITSKEALLFLRIFEKLISDEDMDRFFTHDKGKLLPKGSLLSSSLSYIKKDSSTIEIFLKNGDRILFERD